MKKLITILLATFFICTVSYGATIKELLGSKESIKYTCVPYYKNTNKPKKNISGNIIKHIFEITEGDLFISGNYYEATSIKITKKLVEINYKDYNSSNEGTTTVYNVRHKANRTNGKYLEIYTSEGIAPETYRGKCKF